MKTVLTFFYLLFLNVVSSAQTPSKPFPQHVHYSEDVITPSHISQQQADESVTSFYYNWKHRYLRSNASKNQYYIWTGDATGKYKSVSEGQGYGMIIIALIAGQDTAAQTIYDGLYNYYRSHPSTNSKYLMAWAQTNSFADADGSSASDGDLDIAYSLLLADAQWGSKGSIPYLSEAKAMLGAIMQHEINPITFSVLLSNAIEPGSRDYFDMRSSDFMPAHFKAFKKVIDSEFWDKVIDKNYKLFSLLQKQYSPDAGLVPDFIQHIHSRPGPARASYLESRHDGSYNYNACRVPWRIATDYIVNGDKRSKAFAAKINAWIRSTTEDNPDNISAGYTLQGDDMRKRNFEALSFISSFAVAAMVDAKNQAWLNKLWDYIVGFKLEQFDYYDNTIKLFNLIILSGNYWTPSISN
ncbi:MAG: beta-glucanase [Ferruginibacter sp.]|uniref:glycosyl hydrolase family 8 n=1 Tax=Ferruginibacter sp. TaxID=1940288 RepID=UPI0026589979|nr:glycosyl hydrolase family 8 [Ferruginibacter sp.]MDB5275650.1 beta-glucanase [Ferruginibacter sp.]